MLHDFSLQFVTKSVTSSSAGAPNAAAVPHRESAIFRTLRRPLDCRFHRRLDTLPAHLAKFLPHRNSLLLNDYFNFGRKIMLFRRDKGSVEIDVGTVK